MSSIEISKPYAMSPNSAGGVEVLHEIYNATDKTMKYITITYVPYNSVGDIVSCTVKKISEARCQLTGPILPGKCDFISWKNLWYNPTIDTAKIKEVKIQYMDDTEETISGEDIVDFDSPDSKFGNTRRLERETKEKKKKKIKLIVGGIIVAFVLLSIISTIKSLF